MQANIGIKKNKMKQNILVTGASSGLLLANELHRRGHNVIGTSRNPEKMQTKAPFKIVTLDITDDNSIQSFSKKLFAEIDQLHVLINNAGFYLSGLAEETTISQGKQQFETNFWGTLKLTNFLLKPLKNTSIRILTNSKTDKYESICD